VAAASATGLHVRSMISASSPSVPNCKSLSSHDLYLTDPEPGSPDGPGNVGISLNKSPGNPTGADGPAGGNLPARRVISGTRTSGSVRLGRRMPHNWMHPCSTGDCRSSRRTTEPAGAQPSDRANDADLPPDRSRPGRLGRCGRRVLAVGHGQRALDRKRGAGACPAPAAAMNTCHVGHHLTRRPCFIAMNATRPAGHAEPARVFNVRPTGRRGSPMTQHRRPVHRPVRPRPRAGKTG
jgi:hypothetical protein